jgi:hypothetical protein
LSLGRRQDRRNFAETVASNHPRGLSFIEVAMVLSPQAASTRG